MSRADAAFANDWLALREPADHRARARGLVRSLAEAWEDRGWTRIVDLGAGTGSNLRWLRPRLPGPQRWMLVDRDPGLLSRVRSGPWVTRRVGDLDREGLAAVGEADLVTASALLDLVGAGWMERFVDACGRAACGVYVALTYDGTVEWDPGDGDDAWVLEAVNAHQRRDKGTGPALGPDASATVEDLLRRAGFRTRRAPSPWRLGGGDVELAEALVEGWAGAAREMRPGAEGRVAAWADRRRRTLDSGAFRLTVGHRDVLALPPPDRPGRRPARPPERGVEA